MWSRAAHLSDDELKTFTIEKDLIEVTTYHQLGVIIAHFSSTPSQIRSGPTSYGEIVFGKIRIPAINDEEGEGFVHVRYVELSGILR